MFVRVGNPHLTCWFCKGWVRTYPNTKMVSEPIYDQLDHLLSGHRSRVTLQMFNPGREDCVKSPTLNEIWPEHMVISRGSPHLTNRFCKGWARPNPISKMVLKPIQYPLGHLLSGHHYWTTQFTLQMSSSGCERCAKSPTLYEIRSEHKFISGGNLHRVFIWRLYYIEMEDASHFNPNICYLVSKTFLSS